MNNISTADKMKLVHRVDPDMKEDDFIECLHCGNKFYVKECTIAKGIGFMGEDMVLCKHFPECGGSVIDFMPTRQD